jgi:hypothetical protein
LRAGRSVCGARSVDAASLRCENWCTPVEDGVVMFDRGFGARCCDTYSLISKLVKTGLFAGGFRGLCCLKLDGPAAEESQASNVVSRDALIVSSIPSPNKTGLSAIAFLLLLLRGSLLFLHLDKSPPQQRLPSSLVDESKAIGPQFHTAVPPRHQHKHIPNIHHL